MKKISLLLATALVLVASAGNTNEVGDQKLDFVQLAEQAADSRGELLFNLEAQPIMYSVECCKICKKGKACGDSCISKSYTCHKPKGCACDD